MVVTCVVFLADQFRQPFSTQLLLSQSLCSNFLSPFVPFFLCRIPENLMPKKLPPPAPPSASEVPSISLQSPALPSEGLATSVLSPAVHTQRDKSPPPALSAAPPPTSPSKRPASPSQSNVPSPSKKNTQEAVPMSPPSTASLLSSLSSPAPSLSTPQNPQTPSASLSVLAIQSPAKPPVRAVRGQLAFDYLAPPTNRLVMFIFLF